EKSGIGLRLTFCVEANAPNGDDRSILRVTKYIEDVSRKTVFIECFGTRGKQPNCRERVKNPCAEMSRCHVREFSGQYRQTDLIGVLEPRTRIGCSSAIAGENGARRERRFGVERANARVLGAPPSAIHECAAEGVRKMQRCRTKREFAFFGVPF